MIMQNLTKARYTNKKGCGCQMCKPHKHKHTDRRTRQDKLADVRTAEQMQELQCQ